MSTPAADVATPAAWCYLLAVVGGQGTYVGATVDPDRRLRQHNKEIKGGAHATGIRVGQGMVWRRVCKVPMPDWRTALQFEWRWKQLGRTACKGVKDPLKRRLASLERLLAMEKATEAAIPFDMWPGGRPQVEWEGAETEAGAEPESLKSDRDVHVRSSSVLDWS